MSHMCILPPQPEFQLKWKELASMNLILILQGGGDEGIGQANRHTSLERNALVGGHSNPAKLYFGINISVSLLPPSHPTSFFVASSAFLP